MLGQWSLCILCGLLRREAWGPWQGCPGGQVPVLAGLPLCTRPRSSTPDPPGFPLYSSAGRIMGEIYLKDTFSEECQSWCVYWHNWLCIHKSLFVLDFLVWNTAEAQKWEKVAFVTLATRHGELENSKKAWFSEPSLLLRDIHTQTWCFLRESCIKICPIWFNFTFFFFAWPCSESI